MKLRWIKAQTTWSGSRWATLQPLCWSLPKCAPTPVLASIGKPVQQKGQIGQFNLGQLCALKARHSWNIFEIFWNYPNIFEILWEFLRDFEWFWNILNMFELFCDVLSKFWGDVGKVDIRWYQYHGSREVRRFVCLWANLGSGNEHLDPRGSGLVLYFRAAVFQLGFQIAHNDFPEAPPGHVAWYGSVVISMLSVVYLFGLQGFPMFSQVFFGYSKSVCQFLAFFGDFVANRSAQHRTTICTWLCFWGADLLKPTHLVSNMKRPGEWNEMERTWNKLWSFVNIGAAWWCMSAGQELPEASENFAELWSQEVQGQRAHACMGSVGGKCMVAEYVF